MPKNKKTFNSKAPALNLSTTATAAAGAGSSASEVIKSAPDTITLEILLTKVFSSKISARSPLSKNQFEKILTHIFSIAQEDLTRFEESFFSLKALLTHPIQTSVFFEFNPTNAEDSILAYFYRHCPYRLLLSSSLIVAAQMTSSLATSLQKIPNADPRFDEKVEKHQRLFKATVTFINETYSKTKRLYESDASFMGSVDQSFQKEYQALTSSIKSQIATEFSALVAEQSRLDAELKKTIEARQEIENAHKKAALVLTESREKLSEKIKEINHWKESLEVIKAGPSLIEEEYRHKFQRIEEQNKSLANNITYLEREIEKRSTEQNNKHLELTESRETAKTKKETYEKTVLAFDESSIRHPLIQDCQKKDAIYLKQLSSLQEITQQTNKLEIELSYCEERIAEIQSDLEKKAKKRAEHLAQKNADQEGFISTRRHPKTSAGASVIASAVASIAVPTETSVKASPVAPTITSVKTSAVASNGTSTVASTKASPVAPTVTSTLASPPASTKTSAKASTGTSAVVSTKASTVVSAVASTKASAGTFTVASTITPTETPTVASAVASSSASTEASTGMSALIFTGSPVHQHPKASNHDSVLLLRENIRSATEKSFSRMKKTLRELFEKAMDDQAPTNLSSLSLALDSLTEIKTFQFPTERKTLNCMMLRLAEKITAPKNFSVINPQSFVLSIKGTSKINHADYIEERDRLLLKMAKKIGQEKLTLDALNIESVNNILEALSKIKHLEEPRVRKEIGPVIETLQKHLDQITSRTLPERESDHGEEKKPELSDSQWADTLFQSRINELKKESTPTPHD